MKLRILFVEDSPADAELAVEHLRATGLELEPLRVTGRDDFVEALQSFRPHVILFDHGAPALSALGALEVLERTRLATPLILLTGHVGEAEAASCLRSGADDLVPKSQLARLRPAIDRALALRAPLDRLSPRQLQVLRMVAEGKTTPQIAAALEISVKTADTHRTEMMRRLDIHDVASLARFAVRVGLIDRSP